MRLESLSAVSRAEDLTRYIRPLLDPVIPYRPQLSTKCFRTGYGLALDLEFQAACDALALRGAAEGIGLEPAFI